jgi:transposase
MTDPVAAGSVRIGAYALEVGALTESWIPPADVLEWRERVRLYVSLVNQRTVWCQRIHAELYQHGVAVPEGAIRTPKTRAMLADEAWGLSPAGRQRVTVGYRMIDATDADGLLLKRDLQRFGFRHPACRALVDAQYGIGFLSRRGPQTLRWALYEAAKNSSHLRSPDHDYYAALKARHDGKIAAISVARKLARRCYHVLRNIDPGRVYAIPG